MTDAKRFVEKFREIWGDPDPDRYRDLWTEEGLLLHPGMDEPLPWQGIADYVRSMLEIAPDLRLRVDRWAAADDFVLIEWTITATFRDEPIEWSGVDRFSLSGDRATYGIAYFDTLPLWARVDPEMDRGSPLEQAARASGRA
jgi:SnoaL-like protein